MNAQDPGGQSPHRSVNPDSLPPASGFAHAVIAAPGRTVYLGGQTAHRQDGTITATTIVDQFDAAAANLVTVLEAAGGRPEHLVSLHIYVTDAAAYRAALADLTPVYRTHFGRHYPAMALFEVAALMDPAALLELVSVAVIPDLPQTVD